LGDAIASRHEKNGGGEGGVAQSLRVIGESMACQHAS
jgi:hypothetical protein